MVIYARINEENIVQSLDRERLNRFSIGAELFIPRIDDMLNDAEKNLREFPLSLKQAIELARKLREGKKVLLNPITDYFNRTCWNYSMYINREHIGTLER